MRKLFLVFAILLGLLALSSTAFAGKTGEGDPISRFGAIKWLRTMYAKADYIAESANFYVLDARDFLELKNDQSIWATPILLASQTTLVSLDPITVDVGAWTIREAECHEAIGAIRDGANTLLGKGGYDYMFDWKSRVYLTGQWHEPTKYTNGHQEKGILSYLPKMTERLNWITNAVQKPSGSRNYELIRDWARKVKDDAEKIKSLIKSFAYHNKLKLFRTQN
jgi:hypothetical protein